MKKQLQILTTIFIVLSCFHKQACAQVSGVITTIAGNHTAGYSGDGGPATAAELNFVYGAARYYAGDLYILDDGNNAIRKMDAATGIITTIAGSPSGTYGYSGDGGPATAALLWQPLYLAFDISGNLYFSDANNYRIRKISTSGIITTIAGNGIGGFSGDGGAATDAEIGAPAGIAVDAAGNVYFCNNNLDNALIREINTAGIITTIAGDSTAGYDGDGVATTHKLSEPIGLCIDGSGNLFFVDAGNFLVREISGGIMTTIAGTVGVTGYTGDGGAALSATFDQPQGIAVDEGGNLYVADVENNVVRKINTSNIITTYAGNGYDHGTAGGGYTGDGGPATNAELHAPVGVDVDCSENLYIGDALNNVIRMVGGFANHIPYFTGGTSQSLAVCACSGANSINSLLAIIDSDYGQTEWWTVETPPTTGTLSGFVATGTSTGGVLSPTGLSYTPPCSAGTDSFQIRIADCAGGASLTTIYVTIVSPTSITGTRYMCAGATTTLSGGVPGGTWSSSHTSIATVGSSTGIVTGVMAGTATITYSIGSGCYLTAVVTVNPAPAAIGGSTSVCIGVPSTLTDATGGGVWSSSNTSVATIGSSSGVVNGVATGTATVTYKLPTGCYTTTAITVSSLPGPISTPPGDLCAGASEALYDGTGGGTWSSTNIAIAIVGSTTGIVTGMAGGTTVISYSLATGCAATSVVTVYPLPAAITGTTNVCVGATTALSDATGGGVWSSGNTAIAAVGSLTGIVTGNAPGTVPITYTLPTGCATLAEIIVNPLPAGITGSTNVCVASTLILGDPTGGGSWSCTSVATVGSTTGIVTGVSAGTAIVTYTLPTGCYTTYAVTVQALPDPITGYTGICMADSTHLTDTITGGTWSSSNTSVATISGAGWVTTVSLGTAVITYTLATGCYVTTTVSPLSISGLRPMCAWYDTLVATSVPGGIYTSTLITVTNLGGGIGDVQANYEGIATITYTYPTGCTVDSTVIVHPLPGVIMGSMDACMCGGTTTLTDDTLGGVWTSGDVTIATIGSSSGVVTGVAAGTAPITYTLPTGCYADTAVSVTAPSIGGADTVCVAAGITLTATCGGGIWSSSNTAIATVGSTTGVVTGVAGGLATISYVLCGVTVSTTVTVDTLPDFIVGYPTMVMSTTTTYTDATTGGTWSSSDPAIASIGSATGVITGVDTGTVTITYTVPTGCFVTKPLEVNLASGLRGSAMQTSCSAINIVPNPTKGSFTIAGTLGTGDEPVQIEVMDMLGQTLYKGSTMTHNGAVETTVALDASIADGVYVVNVRCEHVNGVFHVVVER